MGLLDYLFDPNTYGDSPGGLLSRLTASQGNFQSAGFPAQGDPPASFADRFNALPAAPQSPAFTDRFNACRMPMLRPWQLR
jgi:hypothetical protein